jgi:hypothetical protein
VNGIAPGDCDTGRGVYDSLASMRKPLDAIRVEFGVVFFQSSRIYCSSALIAACAYLIIVNPFAKVPVSPGVVTETFPGPLLALLEMLMLAVICIALLTAKLLTVMPEPKLTVVAPVKLVPARMMLSVWPPFA